MKQVLQDMAKGATTLIEALAPGNKKNHVLAGTSISLISTGTERMLVDFGKAGLVSKARQQPEKVRQVLDKVATVGLITTMDAVRSKLAQPIPLGYCNVGRVHDSLVEGGPCVSNGQHADVVSVPGNLYTKQPPALSRHLDFHRHYRLLAKGASSVK
jgi:hypothetical protein